MILRSVGPSPFGRKVRIAASVLGLDSEITIEAAEASEGDGKPKLPRFSMVAYTGGPMRISASSGPSPRSFHAWLAISMLPYHATWGRPRRPNGKP